MQNLGLSAFAQQSDPYKSFEIGEKHFKNQDYRTAYGDFMSVVGRFAPKSRWQGYSFYYAGLCLKQMGDYENSVKLLSKTLSCDMDKPSREVIGRLLIQVSGLAGVVRADRDRARAADLKTANNPRDIQTQKAIDSVQVQLAEQLAVNIKYFARLKQNIKDQLATDTAQVPRRILIGNKLENNTEYDTTIARLKSIADLKIKDLDGEEASKKLEIQNLYASKMQALDQSGTSLDSQASAKIGRNQIVKDKSDLYVRNYRNFAGDDDDAKPPAPVKKTK